MKKLLLVLVSALMFIGILGCSNQGNKEPEEVVVKGEVHDIGRFSILVPEGWSLYDMGTMASDFTCLIIKGNEDEFMTKPSVSVIYSLPTELVVSSAALADNVIQQEPFDLGDYHWTSWTGSLTGYRREVAETEGDFGYLTITSQESMETKELLSLKDPEVQAIIKSIKVRPTIDVDWVSITDGKATAKLTAAEGLVWGQPSMMNTNGVEVDYELDGNTLTLIPSSGTGGYLVSFRLTDTECTKMYADSSIAVKVENGKITGIYDAVINMRETPEDIGGGEDWTDNTDYEAIDKFLIGVWADNPNNLTMFIQKYEEIEHGYQMTIQAADRTIVAVGHVDSLGTLWYENVSINGAAPIESDGWFMADGNSLLWGHDEAVGEFTNANIFSKAE